MEMIEKILAEEQIDEALDEAIRASLITVYSTDKKTFERERSFNGNRSCFAVVFWDGDTVCAHGAVVEAQVVVGQQELRVAGLGYVLVLPEYRGGGLGRRVAVLAMEEAQRRGFDLGMLFTGGTLPEMYAPLGWESFEGRAIYYPEAGQQQVMPSEILRMQYPLKLSALPAGDIYLQKKYW